MRPAPGRPRFSLPRLSPLTLAMVVLALLSGAVTFRLTAEAAAARVQYGTTAPVVVVTAAIEPGEALSETNTTMMDRPLALLPDGAVSDPTGLAARVALRPGEVVAAHHLGASLSGPAALLPDGWRGVAVSTFAARPPLSIGDTVDVLATYDSGQPDGSEPTGVVVERALVIAVTDDAVTVAVPAERVLALAFAVANAVVTVALRA